ncbi:hypothetical protein ACVWYH_001932 [Bradyrhizobium sp. GM24.11]
MAASDYVPIFFKNRLHLAGRPQMSTPRSGALECGRSKWLVLRKVSSHRRHYKFRSGPNTGGPPGRDCL